MNSGSLPSVWEEQSLVWNQLGLFLNSHGTPLANNLMETNPGAGSE